jgi:mannose-6-phosphate isomerase-like protein (cupin superfamily)
MDVNSLAAGGFQIQPEMVFMTNRLLGPAAALALAANAGSVDYYSAGELQSKSNAMAANTHGVVHTAVVTPLAKYGNDYTLLIYRNADGLAEMHEHESDLYVVVDGEATLISGGTLVERKVKSAGEFTASGIHNGKSQVLKKGDVVHIAPNIPHQILVKSGGSVSYFVEKVKE